MSNNNEKVQIAKAMAQLDKLGVKYTSDESLEDLRTKISLAEDPNAVKVNGPAPTTDNKDMILAIIEEKMAAERKAMAAEFEKKMSAVLEAAGSKPTAGMSSEDMLKAVEAIVKGKTDKFGALRPAHIDPNDLIPTQKFFTGYNRWYIRDKRIGGQTIGLPIDNLDKISFQEQYAYLDNSTGFNIRKCISVWECDSNALYRWMTGVDFHTKQHVDTPHPQFGREVFLDVDQAAERSLSSAWRQIYDRNYSYLSTQTHANLLKMCSDMGMPTSMKPGVDELKGMIAEKKTIDEFGMLDRVAKENQAFQLKAQELLRAEGVSLEMM